MMTTATTDRMEAATTRSELDGLLSAYEDAMLTAAHLQAEIAQRAELMRDHEAEALLHQATQLDAAGKPLYGNESLRAAAVRVYLQDDGRDPENLPYSTLASHQMSAEKRLLEAKARVAVLDLRIAAARGWLRYLTSLGAKEE